MKKVYDQTTSILDRLSNAHIVFWSGELHKKFETSYPIGIRELDIQCGNTISNIHGKESYAKIQHFYQLDTLSLHCFAYHILFYMSSDSITTLRLYDGYGDADMYFIRRFPNLEEIYLVNGTNNNNSNCIGESLSKIPNKIKKLTFINCNLSNLDKLQPYCKNNNIELYLS
jgi:hypothetical protein